MSKKNLLQEGTVRRFMKLAGTEAIASDFLNEGHGHSDEDMMQEEEDLLKHMRKKQVKK